MNLEYIGEKMFFEETKDAGHLWVAMGKQQNIYALTIEDGKTSLPVWSSKTRTSEFLKKVKFGHELTPIEVPLNIFVRAWLVDEKMAIVELRINPSGETSTLTLSVIEFEQQLIST